MSVKHPIIAVTGSSGAGTTTVCSAFAKVFQREKIIPFFIEGNSFRRYNREKMREVVAESIQRGRRLSHFGPEVNLFDRMEGVFQEYSRTGSCLYRKYAENLELAEALGVPVGTFTSWKEIPDGSDLLFYEGMHGGVTWESWSRRDMSPSHNPFVVKVRQQMMERADYGIDVARWVDLLIGVVPAINLEWIQKIHRDTTEKGGTQEAVAHAIMRRLPDYIKYITPQFSLTDINFQRVPLVDTSNPFIARDIPCLDESIIVIRFREPKIFDFPDLLNKLDGSFMSRSNTLVVPGSSMEHAMEVICTPMVHRLVEKKRTDKK
jgi:phosphoribulokinase